MKGIIFTEFLEMTERRYGYGMVDQIITETDLPSKGSYTAIGTYSHSEMQALVGKLHEKTGEPVENLLQQFGAHIFEVFITNYKQFFDEANNAFDLLERIDQHIHVAVIKMYPDAELPHFATSRLDPNTLEMIYTSKRHMADFAEGLIKSTLDYYQEKAAISRTNLTDDGTQVHFLISRTVTP